MVPDTHKQPIPPDVVDMHVHVGVVGKGSWSKYGHFSEEYQRQFVFQVFLTLTGLAKNPFQKKRPTDEQLFAKTLEVIADTKVPRMVGLAMDHFVDSQTRQGTPEDSHMWVSNRYLVDKLIPETKGKILFGASVNPNWPLDTFKNHVTWCVDEGAVLMKWLPSAMGINLADDHVCEAMKYLATAGRDGRPLPILLHCGPEHAIPPPRDRGWMVTYDFLSWSDEDEHRYRKFGTKLHQPDVAKIHQNLEAALQAGAVIILAHCGLAYFWKEHSDFAVIQNLLQRSARNEFRGKCYADISALMSKCREPHFEAIRSLPSDLLLYGSDFPVPVFDLSSDTFEDTFDDISDFIVRGELHRILMPPGNLLSAAYHETAHVFGPQHAAFTNFNQLM